MRRLIGLVDCLVYKCHAISHLRRDKPRYTHGFFYSNSLVTERVLLLFEITKLSYAICNEIILEITKVATLRSNNIIRIKPIS